MRRIKTIIIILILSFSFCLVPNVPAINVNPPRFITDRLELDRFFHTISKWINKWFADKYFVSSYDNLADAVNGIGSNNATLIIDEDVIMKENVTIPSNIDLKFVPGSIITTSTVHILLIDSPENIEAGKRQQTFTPGGTVQFAKMGEVYPERWGAIVDDSIDDIDALQAAINSLTSGGKLELQGGTYEISSAWQYPDINNIIIEGKGWATVIYQSGTSGENGFEIPDSVADAGYTIGLVIRDVRFLGNASAGDGVYLQRTYEALIENVQSDNWGGDAFQLNGCIANTIIKSEGKRATNGFHLSTYYSASASSSSNANYLAQLTTRANSAAGLYIDSDATNDKICKGNVIVDGDFESNTAAGTIGIHIKGAQQNRTYSCWMEQVETAYLQETNTGVQTHVPIQNINYDMRITTDTHGIDLNGGNDTTFRDGYNDGLDINVAAGVVNTKFINMRGVLANLTDSGTRTMIQGMTGGTGDKAGLYIHGAPMIFENQNPLQWLDSEGNAQSVLDINDADSVNLRGPEGSVVLQIVDDTEIPNFAKYLKLLSTNGNVGSFTMDTDASTDVANTSVTNSSIILLFPTSANAAGMTVTDDLPFVYSKTQGDHFTVNTASGGNAPSGATFNYIIFN